MAAPTEDGRLRWEAAAVELRGELDIVETSMFEMPSLQVRDGTEVAGHYGEDMVFTLEPDTPATAFGPGRCS